MAPGLRQSRSALETVQDAVWPVLERLPSVRDALPARHARIRPISEWALYDDEQRERRRTEHVAARYWFNASIIVATGLSAFMLGYELDSSGGVPLQERLGYFFMDIIFATTFLVEMIFRQHQLGWDYFLNVWNMFDFTLVVVNFSDILLSMGAEDGGFQMAATLRVVRLLRIAKYVEGIQVFRGMWLLMQGLVNALKTMVWTGLLMLIIVYTSSIIVLTIVSDDLATVNALWVSSPQYVGTLFRAILTTIQVFTLDSWATSIARPLMACGQTWSVLLCIATIVLCNMGVLNIIVALMVERISEMQQSSEDRNKRILKWVEKKVYRRLKDDFCSAIKMKKDGMLDYVDFKEILDRPDVGYKFRLLGISVDEADSMFELMDITKTGAISMEEFCDGLTRIRGNARGIDMVALISFASKQERAARELSRKTHRMNLRADEMQVRMDVIQAAIEEELGFRDYLASRADKVRDEAERREKLVKSWEHDMKTYFPETEQVYHDELD